MRLALLVVVALLGGCAALDTYKTGAAKQAAGAMDALRVDSEWALCRAISVGAWTRAYGSDPDKAQAWRTLCGQVVTETPADDEP